MEGLASRQSASVIRLSFLPGKYYNPPGAFHLLHSGELTNEISKTRMRLGFVNRFGLPV